MKAETWLFGACAIFLVIVTPCYWVATAHYSPDGIHHGGDWTGTAALTMCTLLFAMITAYLGFHANRMDHRPEDREDGEIAEGAGELGFFPPYSWWPLWGALGFSTVIYGAAMSAWWLVVIGVVLIVVSTAGWLFEYYRGEFAH